MTIEVKRDLVRAALRWHDIGPLEAVDTEDLHETRIADGGVIETAVAFVLREVDVTFEYEAHR